MITELITTLIIMIGVGLIAGFIGSILGLGGGLIVTPILTTLMGVDIIYAIPASLIVVIATSSGSAIAYLKDNMINLRVGMFLEIFTSIGGIIGALLIGILAPWILYILFSGFILFSSINMLVQIKKESRSITPNISSSKAAKILKFNSSYYDESLKKQVSYNVKNVGGGSVVMLGAGIMSGLLGIGSGVFKVIAMDTIMQISLKPSSATSNLMMGVTAAASASVYFLNGQILPDIAIPVCLGVLLGAAFGTRVMPKLHPILLRVIFVIVMLFFFIQMLLKAVSFF